MFYIKNTQQLVSHGNPEVRKTLLEIIDAAIAKADPYPATRELVQIQCDQLMVGDLKFKLTPPPRIFILGAGKASFPIARALEDLLGDRITDGLVICKYGQQGSLDRSKLCLASHPIPDEAGLKFAKKVLALAGQTRPGDIVFSCITGGSSALMPLPVSGVNIEEKKKVNRLLLTCGANIVEINAVRKHLSQIKGGFLAQQIHPRARLINLTVSDVIGDALDYITCPTVPDTSTFDDARATMAKYDLWEKVPASVRNHLKNGGPHQETPKAGDLAGHMIHN
ncbi:MAG: glycerate-2-kinase family protein, partial [Deltaproteobacteria bacterium]|nr:glycerate-2-kinase family protein [Deltaproteobacteria bacterium]